MDYEISPDEDRGSFISHARVRSAARTERDPLVGDMVHYWDPDVLACQAALVIAQDDFSPEISLTVFEKAGGTATAHGVEHDEDRGEDTWHWPESE
jgi:hypothetical protein